MTFNQFNNYILMRRLKRKTKRDRRDNAPDAVKRKRYFRQQKLCACAIAHENIIEAVGTLTGNGVTHGYN